MNKSDPWTIIYNFRYERGILPPEIDYGDDELNELVKEMNKCFRRIDEIDKKIKERVGDKCSLKD